MKKTILALLIVSLLVCLFSISISAASTDEFGEIEYVEGMSDKSAFGTDGTKDATSRVVLFDGEEYHTYPSYYICKNDVKTESTFDELNEKAKKSYNIESIIRLEIPENVTKTQSKFRYASNMVYIYLPPTVTIIGQDEFHNCSSLKYVNVPRDCTAIGNYAFSGCSSLEELDMTEAKSLKSLGSHFYGQKLTSLVFPEGFEHFSGVGSASNITYIYFPSTIKYIGVIQNARFTEFVIPDSITSLGNKTFDYCPLLEKVTVPKTLTSIVTGNNPTFFGTSLSNLKEIVYTGSESDPIVEQLKIAVPKATITYANHCETYYGGQHIIEDSTYEFTSFIESSYDKSVCTRCGEETTLEEYSPIMSFTGYSAKINGNSVCIGYTVDRELLKLYEEKTGKEAGSVKIGVTAASVSDGTTQFETIKNDLTLEEKAIALEINSEYKSFEFILSGFKAEHYEKLLVMCAFVYDGSDIYYIDKGGCNTYATPFTFENEAK